MMKTNVIHDDEFKVMVADLITIWPKFWVNVMVTVLIKFCHGCHGCGQVRVYKRIVLDLLLSDGALFSDWKTNLSPAKNADECVQLNGI